MLSLYQLWLALFFVVYVMAQNLPDTQLDLSLKMRTDYDIIINSATPGGIMAAVSASRITNGRAKILLLERTEFIGGLPANGLGATDIATQGATAGLFLEFVGRVRQHYVDVYGEGSKQVRDSNNGYHFEPKVATKVLQGFLDEVAGSVTVLKSRQFDAQERFAPQENGMVKKIRVLNRKTDKEEWYNGKYFIDASYEGDLIAAAKIPFFLGREGASTYNEIGAGVVYKYWGGEEAAGTTHEGDDTIQAFNYRLSITNDPANVYLIPKPANYDRNEYVSLINDIITGCHTGIQAKGLCPREAGDPNVKPNIPGQPNGIYRLTNLVRVPNNKHDGNNQHLAFLSTDLPEENWAYPTAPWRWRDLFAERLRSYTLGLFYFAQNDREVPQWFRNQVKGWGLARDEYTENNYFPRQVYVREGRRMHGEYIFTSNDAMPAAGADRPPVHKDSITSSHYALDSHGVRKREPGRVHLDGFVSYKTPKPYTVPFGVILPFRRAGVNNVLAPVPVSGSHIGFSTLRMEPCWMALGQAAGIAAGLLVNDGRNGSVYQLDVKRVQEELMNENAILVYVQGWQGMSKAEREQKQWELLNG
ncbi:FAD dependent oxidoreductase-domain-containing protein [Pyronema omphalodes]|nr:FAD dependent oxidoreductase-domain-containing protein [Pyronema omphalodes]